METTWLWIVQNWESALGIAFGAVGVISLVVTIVIYFLQSQPKQLDYEIRSDIKLLGRHAKGLREKLEMACAEVLMRDPCVVVIRIRNTGKKSVSETDFANSGPIRLTYESSWPLDVQIIGASSDLDAESVAEVATDYDDLAADTAPTYITPKLLNKGEWFDLQILSDGDHGKITVEGRFADRRRPMRRIDSSNRAQVTRDFNVASASAVIGLALGMLVYKFIIEPPFPDTYLIMGSILAGIILTSCLGLLSKYIFSRIRAEADSGV